jgi:GT2 family glycosyltransferase
VKGVAELSVIIPHYEDVNNLARCLEALNRQTLPRDKWELIISDNGSKCREEIEAVAKAAGAILVFASDRGAGPARNSGVDAASGEIFAFTDADCVPESRWLEEGLRALSKADFVGGEVRVSVALPWSVTAVEAFELVFAFDNEGYVTRKGFTVTANLFCSKTVFDKVGKFRVGVSEDLEWSHRATGLGYHIGYAPSAVVVHPARRSWSDLKRKWDRITLESFLLLREKPYGTARWLLRSLVLVPSALVHTPRLLTSKKISGVRLKFFATLILYRIRLRRFYMSIKLLLIPRASAAANGAARP